MAKPKKKLTADQRRARKQRREEFMTVFMNGKQVSVRHPPTVEGLDAEEFIRRNADPGWLHRNGCWELLHEQETAREQEDQLPPKMPDSGGSDVNW